MRRLVLFGKRPRLGNVKTRLVPPLDSVQALDLYRAFFDDQVRFLQSFNSRFEIELLLDGPLEAGDQDLDLAGIPVRAQGQGNLGERLDRAFARAHRDGATATLIMGTDSPTLPASHVENAFDLLDGGTAVVLGPAEDGGYVLVGLREPLTELFRDVPWSGPDVLRTTVERARTIDAALRLLAPWFDVDDRDGLRRLCEYPTAESGSERAPRTAGVLDSLGLRMV